ncbi:MAG: diadenylate cyclase, partial [Christensenellaceae bacterium]
MQTLRDIIQRSWELLGQLQIVDIIDIIIVAYAIYKLLVLTRETRANQVLKGFGVILIAFQISRWLSLTALVWIFEYIINNIAIVMVVLFQPELRKALEQLGRGGNNIIGRALHTGKAPPAASYDWVVEEIVRAVQNMARSKTGALIIMQRSPLRDILESGTYLYARVSRAILENIFVPNTPLHDGATVISGDTILASGCFLPLTSSN